LGAAIGDTLTLAIGIAISPVPIIAVILMLFSEKARVNGPAFLGGWIAGVLAVTLIAAALSDGADSTTDASDIVYWIKIGLGALLILLGVRSWHGRPAQGEAATPTWMKTIGSFTPVKALGMAVVLAAINPKNLVLAAGAGATIGRAGLNAGETIIVAVVFTIAASATIGGAVIFYLAGGRRAEATLEDMKAWLIQNNTTVMTVLFFVMGAAMAGQGISGLAA
jgi:threonine/homoserine/homoserine lactone efflux protein